MKKPTFSLKNKVVCLIGATGLIGKSIKDVLLSSGAKVYAGSRNIKEHVKEGYCCRKIDISDENSIISFIRGVVAESGFIDVWINCAYPRISYTERSAEYVKTEEMMRDLQTHMLGYFNCCRFVLHEMKKRKKGSIINFGSIYGEIVPDFGIYKNTGIKKDPAYFLNKSGIHMMTRYFAVQAAPLGIRVNTIAPGGIYDNHSKLFVRQYSMRVPMKRMGNSNELSGAVVYLASDASTYMTGQTLFIDGGITIW